MPKATHLAEPRGRCWTLGLHAFQPSWTIHNIRLVWTKMWRPVKKLLRVQRPSQEEGARRAKG